MILKQVIAYTSQYCVCCAFI